MIQLDFILICLIINNFFYHLYSFFFITNIIWYFK